VEIHEVALDYGQEVMQTALRNVQLRSKGKSVAAGKRIGWVRETPVIPASVGVAPSAIAQ
jgi:hypothetical protein